MTDLPIKHLETRMDRLEETISNNHKEILSKIENLDNRFVTRREYEATKETSKGTSSTWQMVIAIVISVGAFLYNILKKW